MRFLPFAISCSRAADVVLAGAMTYPGLKAVSAQKGLVLGNPWRWMIRGIIPAAFEKACREKSPKALYFVPNDRQIRTTATLPEERRRALATHAQKHGVTIIEDDPYAPLRPERIVAMAELAGDITWHIATLSKCATPDLRVAYVVAPNAAKALRLAGVLRATILMAPPLMSALASRWIADGTLEGSQRPSGPRIPSVKSSPRPFWVMGICGGSARASSLAATAGSLAGRRLCRACGSRRDFDRTELSLRRRHASCRGRQDIAGRRARPRRSGGRSYPACKSYIPTSLAARAVV